MIRSSAMNEPFSFMDTSDSTTNTDSNKWQCI